MPNHITNRLIVSGDDKRVAEFFEFIKGDNGAMDFNKVFPMPKELEIEDGSEGEWGKRYLDGDKDAIEKVDSWPESRKQKALELGKAYIDNIREYGYPTWYGWACRNWGTKWNAYDIEVNFNEIRWNTAWNGVPNIVRALSKKFPDLHMEYAFADEDAGYNTGLGETDSEGGFSMIYPDGGTIDSFNIYFDLHPEDRECFRLVNGTYEYYED